MSAGARYYLDPRRLPEVEASRIYLADCTDPRLIPHHAALRDYALRRNVVPCGEVYRAALADPDAAETHVLKHPSLCGLVRCERSGEWVRTSLGDEVLALIEKDRDT